MLLISAGLSFLRLRETHSDYKWLWRDWSHFVPSCWVHEQVEQEIKMISQFPAPPLLRCMLDMYRILNSLSVFVTLSVLRFFCSFLVWWRAIRSCLSWQSEGINTSWQSFLAMQHSIYKHVLGQMSELFLSSCGSRTSTNMPTCCIAFIRLGL